MKRQKKKTPSADEISSWESLLNRIDRNVRKCEFRGHSYNEALAFQRRQNGDPNQRGLEFDEAIY